MNGNGNDLTGDKNLHYRGTGLYELWKTGRYKSYPPDVLVDLVARILALVPPWTRVYRVQVCPILHDCFYYLSLSKRNIK